MKTVGLLGGMSWESTELYYRWVNKEVNARPGGLHSASIAMVSVDSHEIEILQNTGRWDRAGEKLAEAACHVEAAGADFLVICTNTMHKVAPLVEKAITMPILHIADATASRIKEMGIETVGLLGTQFTMEQAFYKGRLSKQHGLNVMVPCESDRRLVHRVIYEELCRGIVKEASRANYLRIIRQMRTRGARGVI